MTFMASQKLTIEHIEHASNSQLSKLLEKDPSTTCHWLKRNFSLGSLDINYSCIDLETLASGLIRRRERAEEKKRLQKEFDEILANAQKLNESVVA